MTMIEKAVAWKLAIFKCAVGAFIIMSSLVIGGLAEADIVSPHAAKVTVFVLSILVAGLKSIDMFVDQSVNNLRKSADPLGLSYDTTQLKRTDVQPPIADIKQA